MHVPGEIIQVANMFDQRIFEDPAAPSAEPNIEFHIHAFLAPNGRPSDRQRDSPMRPNRIQPAVTRS